MENEAPKYASWIPEAGGYVANGKVVSKSPIYENGKLKLDVDTSVFGNTQPQNTVQQTGIQTLNTQGSGTDVNWGMTGAGSLASVTTNTAKTGSALSTPAIQSPLITSKPVDALEQINQRYLDAVARNDYKAMIDELVNASNADGVDRTAQINELWKQRGEKIRNIDNAYLQKLSQATTPEEYNQILGEQQAWRNSVGYADQINKDYQMQEQKIQLDYESAWNQTTNDISSALVQMIPGLLNFQYNPYTDPALNIAQGYAVGKVKETMNATGMYDSSMTQRAITKAITELVPVYEKMAKEEAIQNFNLLQSTASYLMNLDKYQFDMWKSQIEMKWKQNEQDQKAIDNAINNANARGYYTNEEAMLLGIPAGTESYEARKRAQEKQDKIEEEQRLFQQNVALAQIKAQLEMQKTEAEYKLKSKYNTSPSSGLGVSDLVKTLKPFIKDDTSGEDLLSIATSLGKDSVVALSALTIAQEEVKNEKEKEEKELEKTRQATLDKITSEEITDDLKDNVFKTEMLKKYDNYLKGSRDDEKTEEFLSTLNRASENDRLLLSNSLYKVKVLDEIKNQATKFSNDSKPTSEAIDEAMETIDDFNTIASKSSDYADMLLQKGYKDLIDQIDGAKYVDTTWWDWGGSTETDKKEAKERVLNHIKELDNDELYTYVKGIAGL